MLNLAVSGAGYVGLITSVCLAEKGHNVTCVDINEEKINLLNNGKSVIYEKDLDELLKKNGENGRLKFTIDYETAYKNADAIFIAVDTCEQADGSANLANVYAVADNIAATVKRDCTVIIKSTVPVGTCRKVKEYIQAKLPAGRKVYIVDNPEFLSQGTAVKDALYAARIVLGIDDEKSKSLMQQIYEPFDLPIYETDLQSAEMIKYACNSFLAIRISFMNEIANLCANVGANIDHVKKGMAYDERIGKKFLNAGIGYGGSCFPKDTKALCYVAEQTGCTLETVKSAIRVNEKQRTILYRKAKEKMESFKNKSIAVLGLTFKPGTDDVRESPALINIRLLLEEDAHIKAYDPIGIENAKRVLPEIENLQYCKDIVQTIRDTEVCFIFTEWDCIKAIPPETFIECMNYPVVYDGRNCFNPNLMEEYGIYYFSIGRPKQAQAILSKINGGDKNVNGREGTG